MNTKSYIPAFMVLLYLAVLHYYAIIYKWYFHFWWTDVMAHALGGLWIGLTVYWLIERFRKVQALSFILSTAIIICTTVFIAIGWEIFEFIYKLNESYLPDIYLYDTVSDIIMAIIGSGIASIYTNLIQKKNEYR
ncbi:MAG: hypothetical protein Q7R78_03005 [bacterium]|nr:hypothetical protein [bacterium]